MPEKIVRNEIMEIWDEGRNEGINLGLNRGIELVAVNMLRDNVNISTVQKFTGLSLSRIQELSKKPEMESSH